MKFLRNDTSCVNVFHKYVPIDARIECGKKEEKWVLSVWKD